MKSKRFIYFILFFSSIQYSFGQSLAQLPVRNISFTGLTKTKPQVLEKWITSNPSKIKAHNQIDQDIQRLKNFPGIGNVTAFLDTVNNQVNLTFQVEEVRTLLPIVNFGGITGNVWFQLGFTDINFRGEGDYISAYYQNSDRRHSGQVYFRAPRIKNSNFGFSTSLTRWASVEPLFFPNHQPISYNYDYNSLAAAGIYQLGQNRQLELGANYFVEKYKKLVDGNQVDTPGPNELSQPKLLASFEYKEDFFNYHFFSKSGFAWNLLFQEVYNVDENSHFRSLQVQAQYFALPIEEINLALRLRFGISNNNDSPFAPFVVDSHVNLRGVGNRIDRGTAQLILNAEYRHTVYHSDRWGGQLVGFADIGTWRNPGGELKDLFDSNQFREFLGLGFRIIYKKIYGAVLRVDYGIDVVNPDQRGLVIGFGQYF